MKAEAMPTCDQVLERLVAATEQGGAAQAPGDQAGTLGGFLGPPATTPPGTAHLRQRDVEHARSCVSCFRVMTELRDVPRLAEALREAAPAPEPGERFWEALAERAADAVSAALASGPAAPAAGTAAPVAAPPALPPGAGQSRGRPTRLRGLRARFVSIGTLAVAAAAGLVLVARHPGPSIGPRGTESGPAAEVARAGLDDGASETFGEVADLDAGALHRLLDRLGHHGPVPLASGDDGADVPSDDEARVSDAIAELDGDALRRVASSLEASAL